MVVGEEERGSDEKDKHNTGTSSSSSCCDTDKSKVEQLDSSKRVWIKFYEQALTFVEEEETSSNNNNNNNSNSNDAGDDDKKRLNQRIIVTLETITRVLFGLDSERKSWAVLYGKGTLELIVALVNKQQLGCARSDNDNNNNNNNSRKLHFCVIKALKTCALRNPPGRSRCRSAGVFTVLNDLLEFYIQAEDAEMANEALTTLAAICLGDELNSLQGAVESQKHIDAASHIFSADANPSMHQKIMYLKALFETMRKEQSDLLKQIEGDEGTFFSRVIEMELELRNGSQNILLAKEKWILLADAESNYDRCLDMLLIQNDYMSVTRLLQPIYVEIHNKRATLRLKAGNALGCIEDLDVLLEQKLLSTSQRFDGLKMKATAYLQLERNDDAREALGKALLMKQGDPDVTSQLEAMDKST